MVITLCGSSRFEPWFKAWNTALGMAGHAAFGLSAYPSEMGGKDWYTPTQKRALDALHIEKIHASEAIVVLNVFGYLGESTLREIAAARKRNLAIYFLDRWPDECGIPFAPEAAKRYDVAESYQSRIVTIGERSALDSTLLGPHDENRAAIVALLAARHRAACGEPTSYHPVLASDPARHMPAIKEGY